MRTFLVWLVLACLLPGVLGATALFIYQYRQGLAQHEKDMIQTARALMQAVDSHLLRGQAIAQTLATADSLVKQDLAQFHQRARETLSISGLGSNVVLRDEAGRQLLNTAMEFGQPLTAPAAPDQVRGVFTTGNSTVSDLFAGAVLKRPVMSVDVPVIIDGKVAYALGVGILPEHFNEILKAQNLPPDWVAAVLDSTGTIVGRTHAAEKFVGNKATAKLLQSIMTSPEGSLEATTQEGTPVLTFHSRSPATNWGIAIGIPRQSLQAALLRTLSMLAIGVAALFGISLVLVRFMGARIAHSIKALTAPAIALGSGGSAPVPRVHIKEAAEVATAIGRAATLLKERDATLEARDAELEEAHRFAKFGTWHWDLLTGETKTSDSIREIYGREVLPFRDQRGTVFTIEAWERLNTALKETIRTSKSHDIEEQVNHGNGSTVWLNFKCEALRNEMNQVVALHGAVQDITERKRAEERMRESEERFRLLADNIAQLAWMADGNGRIFWYNRRWFDYTGTTLDEMQDDGAQKVHHPDHVERIVDNIRRCFETGQPWKDTFPLRGKDGGYRWFLSQAIPIHDGTGKVVRWFGTNTDITEQRAAEEAARESHQLLKTTMDNFPTVIAFKDKDGRFLDANQAVENVLGLSKEQIHGRTMYDFIPKEAADVLREHDLKVMETRRAMQSEKATPLPGNTLYHLDTSFPLIDAQGNVYGTGHISHDVTLVKHAEAALRTLNQQLQEADRRKDEFLAMLAHELRNPLAPISAAADLLAFGRLDESRVKQTSTIIARQVKHMTGLVDDLLDVSRVTRGLITLERRELDAIRIVSDALEQVGSLMEVRGHCLAVNTPPGPVLVRGDHKRLVQVLTNLLHNAAKFTPEGGEIVLNMVINGGHVKVSVTDNGIGMAPGLVQRAFDLFIQGERTPDRSQGGLGIGLALVKSLVELHDGSVDAASEGIGKGSRFTVCLPHLKQQAGLSDIKRGVVTGRSPVEALKVMVVDDNADAAMMLAMFVEALGHQVLVEYSSIKAFEHARVELPNVYLLDIGLPEMDGNELARRLRAQPETAKAILVAVTGYGQEQDRKNAFSAGFDHHFVKPLDTTKLAILLSEIERL